MKKEVYLVEGMTCAGCERAIQRTLSGLTGITQAKADLSSSTLSVEYDPSVLNVGQIRDAVTRLGYRIAGERPSAGQCEGSDEAVS